MKRTDLKSIASDAYPSPDRRAVLRAFVGLGAAAGSGLVTPFAVAAEPAPAAIGDEGAAFDRAVADDRWLVPFKGLRDDGPAGGDLRCAALAVSGRWPTGLRGRFYRNGPAIFERAGRRYHHWFDGDGMVQQFTLGPGACSHVGRFVRTPKLVAERAAGRFLYSTFGTGIRSEAPMQGPDSMNVANTNAIEHAGRVLAMWEGGSAFAMSPADLSTTGPVTWREGFEQMPFSAHPKLDRSGHLWNIGTFADKLVVWHIDAAGKLASVQTGTRPFPGGLAHDVAITANHIVLPLPPVRMNYAAIAKGATPEQAFDFQRREPLRILVMSKNDITQRRVFELPAQMVFHVGNAYERPDGSIELTFVGADNDEFLIHGAVALVAGQRVGSTGSSTQSAVLDMRTGRARVESMADVVEFPRVDPRRIGTPARLLVSTANWKTYPRRDGALFHGLQVRDLKSGRVERFDYGERMVVEEHIVVPKPRSADERDAWLLGTTFDAARQVTTVNVLDLRHVADGPIAQAVLPYWLPFGFHGNFTAA